ncbi:zinc-dependent metalloprotease [Streptomyces anulatus]|uniref:zinc-dependent metalloprotease n=1 Tax=Streptomyces anulatus TaxID=1892 RepID=UPI003669044E
MTVPHVLDTTDGHEALRTQVEQILQQVIPLVGSTTELPLPPRAVYRLVDVETWQSEQQSESVLIAHALEDAHPAAQRQAIRESFQQQSAFFREAGPVLGGILVMGATQGDTSQTLLVPEALQHSGVLSSPEYLTQVIAHELTHQFQNYVSARATWPARRPAALRRYRSVKVLEEGHAYWTDRKITEALFGKVWDAVDAPRSDTYLQAEKQMGPMAAARREPYTKGLALVETAVEAVGLTGLNRVWSRPDLLPDDQEVESPELWASRLESSD